MKVTLLLATLLAALGCDGPGRERGSDEDAGAHPDAGPGADAGGEGAGAAFVVPVSGPGLIRLPEHAFDLEDKTVTFTPKDVGYQVDTTLLAIDPDRGSQLPLVDAARDGDGVSWTVPLSFSFPFGGEVWTSVHVNVNGNLSFGASEAEVWDERSPWASGTVRSVAAAIGARASAGTERVIAPLWAIYSPEETEVHVRSANDRLVVTWIATRPTPTNTFYQPLGENVFQATILSSGTIAFSYEAIAELDGIAGVFPGDPADGMLVDGADDGGDGQPPRVDIVSLAVHDLGSVLRFTFQLVEPVPVEVPSGTLEYRIFLTHHGQNCQVSLSVTSERRSGNSCSAAPGTIGYRVTGNALELFVSKLVLDDSSELTWSASVDAWGSGQWDSIGTRPISLTSPSGRTHLASAPFDVAGNAFDVFHYPVVPKQVQVLLSNIYATHPPEDDIALVFSDFRMDDLYGHGGGTTPINVAIHGIGPGLDAPGSGESFGSNRLQIFMAPVWVGQPRFARVVSDDDRTYEDHAFAITWIIHEATHRFGVKLRRRDPLTDELEQLGDDFGHWVEGLEAPPVVSIASGYSEDQYVETSPMGGSSWREELDGTFTKLPKPYMAPSGFSALDLYAMGLVPAEEVPDTFLLRDLVWLGDDRYSASKISVTIDDIVAAEGDRIPTSSDAMKEYAMTIYLIHPTDRDADPAMVHETSEIADAAARYFATGTGDRMRVVPGTR